MDRRDQITELERQWKQASEVAFLSIGQPDRAENVAYRDELAKKLRIARAEARRHGGLAADGQEKP